MIERSKDNPAQYLAAVHSTALNSAPQRGPSDTPLNIAQFRSSVIRI
jgi:hypothetical protein